MPENSDVSVRHDPFELFPRRGRLLDWLFEGEWPRAVTVAPTEGVAVDISRKGSDLIVRASMPGVDAKEINVEVSDGVLSISAEHTEGSEEQGERFYRRERRSSAFNRIVPLPEAITEDKMIADFKNGVLTVIAPVAEKPKTNKITVQAS